MYGREQNGSEIILLVLRSALSLVGSYLLGGILGGALAARVTGKDLRRMGSGNPGTTNVLRSLGPIYALATLLVDVLKGVGASLLGRWVGLPGLAEGCGALVVIGHSWPVTASFRGGKGIATALGTLIVLAPKTLWIILPLWLILILATGYVSVGSVVAASALPLVAGLLYRGDPRLPYLLVYVLICAGVAVFRHRENLARLRRGEEHKLWRAR